MSPGKGDEYSYLVKEERDDWRRAHSDRLRETEGTEKRRRVEESGEECHDGEEVELGHEEELCRVQVVPVTKLMRENGFNLFGFGCLIKVSKMTMCLLWNV